MWLGYRQNKPVSVHRRKNYYEHNIMYGLSHFKYKPVIRILSQLEKGKLVNKKNGFYDRKVKKGYCTRYWASSELAERFRVIDEQMQSHGLDEILGLLPIKQPLILKSKDKRMISYEENNFTTQARNDLERINQLLEITKITWDYDPTRDDSLLSSICSESVYREYYCLETYSKLWYQPGGSLPPTPPGPSSHHLSITGDTKEQRVLSLEAKTLKRIESAVFSCVRSEL